LLVAAPHNVPAFSRRLLPPIRPGVGTDDSAAGAHHAWSECRHRGDRATGPRSGSSGGGTANTTPRSTARRWRACCPAS
jgi:hypothetical protein